MEKKVWQDYFESLGRSLVQLKDILSYPDLDKNNHMQDAAIQRFEFSIELYWKVIKKFLLNELVETTTPRDVLQKAYQFKIIDDEDMWLAMLKDRNITSHVYDEDKAKRVFENIKQYYPVMESTYSKLQERFYK